MQNLAPRTDPTDIACIADIPVVAKGTSTFAGSGSSRTIAHGLGSAPSSVSITPTANPSGNLGEVWATSDATNIVVYNTGSATTAFAWVAYK